MLASTGLQFIGDNCALLSIQDSPRRLCQLGELLIQWRIKTERFDEVFEPSNRSFRRRFGPRERTTWRAVRADPSHRVLDWLLILDPDILSEPLLTPWTNTTGIGLTEDSIRAHPVRSAFAPNTHGGEPRAWRRHHFGCLVHEYILAA
jgi:hypothetical protein